MVVTFLWIFENILVKTPPQKFGDSRAPLGLRRPRGAATSHPHSITTTCRRKNGRRCPTSARGERGDRHPGDGSLFPPRFFFVVACYFFLFRTPTIRFSTTIKLGPYPISFFFMIISFFFCGHRLLNSK